MQTEVAVDGNIATLMQQQLQAVTQLIQSQLQILGSAPAGGVPVSAGRNAKQTAALPKTEAAAAAYCRLLRRSSLSQSPSDDHPLLQKQVSAAGHQA